LASARPERVAVLGPSGLPPRQRWTAWLAERGDDDETSRRIAAVTDLEAAGTEVRLADVDLTDGEAVAAALTALLDELDGAGAAALDLRGVLQASGEQGPELARGLAELDRDFLRYRLASRLAGVPAVQRTLAARGVEPGFWLLASTVASAVGGPSIAADCAADLYLDALARAEDRRGGEADTGAAARWTAVDWDALRPSDGAAGVPGLENAIAPAEAADAFDRLLAGVAAHRSGVPQVIVSTTDLAGRVAAARRAPGTTAAGGEARGRPELANEYVAPESDAERQIQAIWEDVLGVAGIGVEDNFFDLGGNSLVATQLVSRLRGTFRIDLPLQDFFAGATIADVARSLEVARWVQESGDEAVTVGADLGADEETGEI
jgi:acyl carrier protein